VSFVTGGGRLVDDARARGFEVTVLADMVPQLSPTHDLRAVRQLTRFLLERQPDVVHTHSAKAGGIGRIAARRAGVPRVVHTYHGFPFHEFQHPWTRTGYVLAERQLCRRTDTLLAVGSAVAVEAVRKRIARPDQIRTTPVTVDDGFQPADDDGRRRARALLRLDEQARVVGTVGRLDYQKAPEDFCRALQLMRHRDAVGVWVGDGPLRPRVERQLRQSGLADRVLLVGERTDVPQLLPAFDVFAMSSRYEGLPCAVVEAMLAGIPVVATAVNAVPDVVLPGETGLLVPPQNPAALAGALDAVLDDLPAARRRAVTGLALVDGRFGVAHLGRLLAEVYDGAPATGAEPGRHFALRAAVSDQEVGQAS
jgi:glycosyltransferase involved in cell wall biosynthesis